MLHEIYFQIIYRLQCILSGGKTGFRVTVTLVNQGLEESDVDSEDL